MRRSFRSPSALAPIPRSIQRGEHAAPASAALCRRRSIGDPLEPFARSRNHAEDWFSTAQYFDIKTGHTGFEDVAIAIGDNENLTGDGEPERIGAIRMSSNLLPMLGARPAFGRLFTPADDTPGQAGSALLSYGTWVRRYGADPNVLGRSLSLNGQPYEIVGVLPASFSLPREVHADARRR